jgi:hypothetical protein
MIGVRTAIAHCPSTISFDADCKKFEKVPSW